MDKSNPTYAKVKFPNDPKEHLYDLYKTKLGVHTSDMWYDIACHTDNNFKVAGEIENWAKDAEVGQSYSLAGINISITT